MKNQSNQTAAILGATGLIGSRLLDILRSDDHFSSIRVISRRPVALAGPKTEVRVIDFENMEQFRAAIEGCDVVFCSVGTTQKKVSGDEEAYRKVDFDIPVNAARFCAETGCGQFLLVSSVGADSNSSNFYTRLKGETEEAVKSSGVRSISIFRPSILLGEREESRPSESIGKAIMTTFSFLLPSRVKPVHAADVAAAMLTAAKIGVEGFTVYKYRAIMQLKSGQRFAE